MMDELFALQSSTTPYSMQLPGNMVSVPTNCHTFQSPVVESFPVFGWDQLFSGSSVSDGASKVAETHRGGAVTAIGTGTGSSNSEEEVSSAIRAKIASHPLYPKLLQAYIDCQKVGAPPEMAYWLDEIRQESNVSKKSTVVTSYLGADPELDEFMETYCEILAKYKSDLSKPFNEATTFLNDVEAQLNTLCNNGTSTTTHLSDEAVGSSDEDASGGEAEVQGCPCAKEDREIRDKLMRKYSGCISTLKHEFSKKKKGGKLPKEARRILLNWWNTHYKWPYPTETDKVGLSNSTGLDQKQINNWFINQRKRHWRPSENMQFAEFAVVDGIYRPLS